MAPTAPGEGERRAIGGYYPQYRIAASLILRQLRDETLQWIRVADPDAGRVDDIQIGSANRVDAFQVKWHQYPVSFTYGALAAPSSDAPSLIFQLADGWNRLRHQYPGKRVVVHLITNAIPSTAANQQIPLGNPLPQQRHLAAFLSQAWFPSRNTTSLPRDIVPDVWKSTWDALVAASGLSAEQFAIFIRDCELEFGYRLPELDSLQTSDLLVVQHDIRTLTEHLFATVADPKHIVELSREALVLRLGWQNRFTYRSRHEFPVDLELYRPVEQTVQQLLKTLTSLPGGYIAVLGTPGSGKSSLLTETLRPYPARVVRYYAYVPDAQDPIVVRGEAANFWHDVVLSLERSGFRIGESISTLDREQLLHRFHSQLHALHEDWKNTGQQTILVIDGLDHIAREQHPNRSLLYDLPLPDQVPEGVFLVLGSQTDQLQGLPDRVQFAIRQPERRIEMEPLSREAVGQIVVLAGLSSILSNEQRDQIYSLSGGHPLALTYLLQRLKATASELNVEVVLNTAEPYTGDIEAQYHSYWRQIIEQHVDAADLLGLLSRLRGVIDWGWVRTWAPRRVADSVQRMLPHYFRRESIHRWYFFHNSFRLFLLRKTTELTPGDVDLAREQTFHRELANYCSQAPANSRWAWEELYHRCLAGEHETVVERATQAWFRQQAFSHRPLLAIRTDAQLALRSAIALRDPVALARLLLVMTEMDQRHAHLEETEYVSLLLELGEADAAAENGRNGNQLRLSAKKALDFSGSLDRAGLSEEARHLFELAEPLELLASGRDIQTGHRGTNDDPDTLLEAWVAAVPRFRLLPDIIQTIRRLRREGDRFGRHSAEDATRALQSHLLFHLGHSLLNMERWTDLSTVAKCFELEEPQEYDAWFWLQTELWRYQLAYGDERSAEATLAALLQHSAQTELDDRARAAIAEGVYRIRGDVTESLNWLRDVVEPPLMAEVVSSEAGLRPFRYRFRLQRLRYALGDQRSPSDIVPDTKDPRQQGTVFFERILCVIARIWADAWRGQRIPAAIVVQEIRPLLRFFNRSRWQGRDWSLWYAIRNAQGEFYALLVDAVAQHGRDATVAVGDAFEQEWRLPEAKQYWPTDVRREVILSLWRAGISKDWAMQHLRALELDMGGSDHVFTRLREIEKHIRVLLALGERDSSQNFIHKLLQASFTVGNEKDYQVDKWIQWLGMVSKELPEAAPERIAWFSRTIFALKYGTEGHASSSAAQDLLAITFDWSPRRSIQLSHWLFDHGLVSYDDGLWTLIQATLKGTAVPVRHLIACVMAIGLPFAAESHPDDLGLLIQEIAKQHGTDETISTARELLAVIAALTLPGTRSGWRRGIARAMRALNIDLAQLELRPQDLHEPSERNTSYGGLKLKDGTVLIADEVIERTHTVDDLKALWALESNDSYFDWQTVVAHLAPALQQDDVLIVADLFQEKHRQSLILSILSQRLLDLGLLEDAWALAERALQLSTASGWSIGYDGGTRLKAFNTLARIDPRRTQRLVYATLLQDVQEQPWVVQSITLYLDKILPLLVNPVPVRAVWTEVEQYSQALFEGFTLHKYSAYQPFADMPNDTSARAYVDFILAYLDHPIGVLRQSALYACSVLLRQNDSALRAGLEEYLKSSSAGVDQLFALFDAVSLDTPEVLRPLQKQIVNYCDEQDYALRQTVRRICTRLGWTVPLSLPKAQPLPVAYSIALPPNWSGDLVGVYEVLDHEPLPDSVDPTQIVRPFHVEFDIIAKAADIPFVNVCYRAVQIMRELSSHELWSAAGERQLRANLEAIDMRYTFERPKARLARKALFIVIAELVDAGSINPDRFADITFITRRYDPGLLFIQPQKRPLDIHPIGNENEYSLLDKRWVHGIEESALYMNSHACGEHIILAEETKFKGFSAYSPTETRRRKVFPGSISNSKASLDVEKFFPLIARQYVREYAAMRVQETPEPIILRHAPYGYDTAAADWLALNPAIGYALGWQLDENGLFKWIDHNGRLMVESIWWMDGHVSQYRVQSSSVVGEGWLVVATPEAMVQLRDYDHSLRIQWLVQRVIYNEQQGEIEQLAQGETTL
jgi:hypothetical protein